MSAEEIRETSTDNYAVDASRIAKVQKAFESSENIHESCYCLIKNVEESLESLKGCRNEISSRLCETLAKNESMRKKDFNIIMDDIYGILAEKEKNAWSDFIEYVEDQKEFTGSMKNIILNIQDYMQKEDSGKSDLLKRELMQVAALQEERKNSVTKKLTDFQNMHRRVMKYLESLLTLGHDIKIKDIRFAKTMIDFRSTVNVTI